MSRDGWTCRRIAEVSGTEEADVRELFRRLVEPTPEARKALAAAGLAMPPGKEPVDAVL